MANRPSAIPSPVKWRSYKRGKRRAEKTSVYVCWLCGSNFPSKELEESLKSEPVGSEMAQWVNAPASRSEDLSLAPGPTWWGEPTLQSCSRDTWMWWVHMLSK